MVIFKGLISRDSIQNIRILYILTMARRGDSIDYAKLNAGPFSGVTAAASRTPRQQKIDKERNDARNDARKKQWKQHLEETRVLCSLEEAMAPGSLDDLRSLESAIDEVNALDQGQIDYLWEQFRDSVLIGDKKKGGSSQKQVGGMFENIISILMLLPRLKNEQILEFIQIVLPGLQSQWNSLNACIKSYILQCYIDYFNVETVNAIETGSLLALQNTVSALSKKGEMTLTVLRAMDAGMHRAIDAHHAASNRLALLALQTEIRTKVGAMSTGTMAGASFEGHHHTAMRTHTPFETGSGLKEMAEAVGKTTSAKMKAAQAEMEAAQAETEERELEALDRERDAFEMREQTAKENSTVAAAKKSLAKVFREIKGKPKKSKTPKDMKKGGRRTQKHGKKNKHAKTHKK